MILRLTDGNKSAGISLKQLRRYRYMDGQKEMIDTYNIVSIISYFYVWLLISLQ